MGKVGGLLALVGVIVCPISSGDTAYRSARLTLADWFKFDQSDTGKRLLLTVPLLGAGCGICFLDYNVVWRYFSWSNQTLAMIVLWTISVYLRNHEKKYMITAIPAVFMSAVSVTYFFVAPECLALMWGSIGISQTIYYPIGIAIGIIAAFVFFGIFMKKATDTAGE